MSGSDSVAALTIRDAVAADTQAIVALVESAYRGESSRVGWTTEADYLEGRRTGEDEVGPAIDDPSVVVLAGEQHGILVACCRLDRYSTGYSTGAMFGMFAVSPTLQSAGLGSRLLAAAEERAVTEWGVKEMFMTVVHVRSELLAYYARRGYLPTGETKPFPYGQEEFGHPLRDDLHFVVLRKRLG